MKIQYKVYSVFLLVSLFFIVQEAKSFVLSDDVIAPYISSNLLYDSNYLRLSNDRLDANGRLVPRTGDRTEFLKIVTAGFNTNIHRGSQEFVVSANVNESYFQNNVGLNYTGWDTLSKWNWLATNQLKGEIGYSNKELLGSYDFLNGINAINAVTPNSVGSYVANLRNDQNAYANGNYLFHPNGNLKLGWFRTQYTYDDASRSNSNNLEDNGQIDLQYLSPVGHTLGVRVTGTKGLFPNRNVQQTNLDNDYYRLAYVGTWESAEYRKLRFSGFAGYTEQHFAHFSTYDFNSFIGRFVVNYTFSPKTSVELIGKNEVMQAQSLFATFYQVRGIELNPVWQLTPKFKIKMPFSYTQMDILGSTNNISSSFATSPYSVTTNGIGLNFNYLPIEHIDITTVINYQNRDSANALRSFDTFSAGMTLQALF